VPNNRGVVIGASGVTFGRGLDLGQQSDAYIKSLFDDVALNASPLSNDMRNWLLGSVGLKGSSALSYCNNIDSYVNKKEQFLTRKQQYYLFLAVYKHQYQVTKRVLLKGVDFDGVVSSADIDVYEKKFQDVLVDLTFRGDNSPRTRRYFIKDLISGAVAFKSNVENLHWRNTFGVPEQRFKSRKDYLLKIFKCFFCFFLSISSAGLSASDNLSDYQSIETSYRNADNVLNEVYKKQIEEFKSEGAGFYGQGISKDVFLKKSQIAWIKARDEDCKYETYEAQTGTGFSGIFKQCLLDKTLARIKYLKENN
jgi:uncharacterized protein YecT (DUF1311 family)